MAQDPNTEITITHVAGFVGELFSLDGMCDLMILPCNKLIIRVPIGVVLDQNLSGLLEFTIRGQPSWRFRCEQQNTEDHGRTEDLEDGGHTPLPVPLGYVKTGDYHVVRSRTCREKGQREGTHYT